METGRAVVAKLPDGDLELIEKPKTRAPPGFVVVRMILRPVNHWELWLIKKKCAEIDSADPADEFSTKLKEGEVVPGSDGVGIVDEVGQGVTNVQVGQRVVPYIAITFDGFGQGSWQDYVVIPADLCFAVPDTIPDEIAAMYIGICWGAYAVLKDIGVSEGQYFLQTAAASVLGRMVIQLAKHWGIKTINIVRRDDVIRELRDLGADEVINSATEDVVAKVKEITGSQGADCAIDTIGGIFTKTVASSVKNDGRIFVMGSLGGSDDSVMNVFDLGRVKIQWWMAFLYMPTPERMKEVAENVMELLESKVITPFTGKTFKLEEFKEAIEETFKPARGGKVLLCS